MSTQLQVLVELIFAGVFKTMPAADVAALLSCEVVEEKEEGVSPERWIDGRMAR